MYDTVVYRDVCRESASSTADATIQILLNKNFSKSHNTQMKCVGQVTMFELFQPAHYTAIVLKSVGENVKMISPSVTLLVLL